MGNPFDLEMKFNFIFSESESQKPSDTQLDFGSVQMKEPWAICCFYVGCPSVKKSFEPFAHLANCHCYSRALNCPTKNAAVLTDKLLDDNATQEESCIHILER